MLSIENTLSHDWNSSGIKTGDTVLLHSNVSNTLRRIKKLGAKPSLEIILNSFLAAVGKQGTLILPLFNFDFTEGVSFDINKTPSQMGALTELARKHPNAVRTGHPIYSFAAIGANANKFKNVRNFSGYGKDSPFGIIHELNGKIAVLDLPDQNSMTFYHYVEEACNVSYRYHKTFTAPYKMVDGTFQNQTFGLFVRNLEMGVQTNVNSMEKLLWKKKLFQGSPPNTGSGLRVINAEDLFNETMNVIKNGNARGLLYEIE